MASPARAAVRHVRPLLSATPADARRRVLNLYKSWYRQVPFIVLEYDIPKNEKQVREKIRELFAKNANVTDLRVIDTLVIKGQMELMEVTNIWKNKHHVMFYWKDTQEKKPTDFLSKFLAGQD